MRCEGYISGPHIWEQCKAEAITILIIKQNNFIGALPTCTNCWDDVKKDDDTTILSVDPIPKERFEHER